MSTPTQRSFDLLQSIVTPGEWEEFKRDNRITVTTTYGTYIIWCDQIRFRTKNDLGVWDMCIVFRDYLLDGVPRPDWIIMKYLLIKGDEKRLWATAIVTGWGTRPLFSIV